MRCFCSPWQALLGLIANGYYFLSQGDLMMHRSQERAFLLASSYATATATAATIKASSLSWH